MLLELLDLHMLALSRKVDECETLLKTMDTASVPARLASSESTHSLSLGSHFRVYGQESNERSHTI